MTLSRSTNVEFGGGAFEPDMTYCWSVRIRGVDSTVSAWSNPTKFTTALSDEAYWDDKCICADLDPSTTGTSHGRIILACRATKVMVLWSKSAPEVLVRT